MSGRQHGAAGAVYNDYNEQSESGRSSGAAGDVWMPNTSGSDPSTGGEDGHQPAESSAGLPMVQLAGLIALSFLIFREVA